MLNLLRSTVVYVGFFTAASLAAASLAIAPRLMAQPSSSPIQISYSKLDVNAIDLYYSDSVEIVESSNSEEVVDLETISEESMLDDSSDETTSLQ